MASNVRFLDQVSVSTFGSTGGGEITIASASVDLGTATTLNFTGSGITSITNVSGYATINISGTVGPQGSTGPVGPTGPAGPEGNLAVWQYSSNTDVDSDPGIGYFRINTAWNGNTSTISIDDFAYSPSINLGSILNGITINSIIKLTSLTNSNNFKYLQVTAISPPESGYEKYTVSQLATNGSATDNDQFGLAIPAPASNALEILYTGSSVVAAATAIDFSGSGFSVTNMGGGTVLVSSNFIDPFPYTGSAIITGSLELEGPFLVKLNDNNGDINKFQVNNEGAVVLGKLDTTPTAVSGGIFYSASNEFFLGFA